MAFKKAYKQVKNIFFTKWNTNDINLKYRNMYIQKDEYMWIFYIYSVFSLKVKFSLLDPTIWELQNVLI